MKAIIVDDEVKSRLVMEVLLKQSNIDFTSILQVDGVEAALNVLEKNHVDFLFLDIKMKDGTGFDFLKKIEKRNWSYLIFVTAYDGYAIQAIKFSANDYLMKPVDREELNTTLSRCLEDKVKNDNIPNFENEKFETINLLSKNGYEIFNLKDINYIKADGNYSIFYFSNKKQVISSKTLKYYDELLINYEFIRVHKSYIVNKEEIGILNSSTKSSLNLKCGMEIPISRRKYRLLKDKILNKTY